MLPKWGRLYDSVDYGKDMGTSYMEEMGLTEPPSFEILINNKVSVWYLYCFCITARYKTVLGIINESDIFIPPNELNTRQYNVYEI